VTYLYRAADGSFVEREFKGSAPERLRLHGKTFRKHSIVFDGGIHAYTMTGEKLHKHEERTYRTNKCTAEGLANGTMRPPDYRDAAGDKQSRESINQLNRMYRDAKEKAGKPIIG
jgi:hypothetical protein